MERLKKKVKLAPVIIGMFVIIVAIATAISYKRACNLMRSKEDIAGLKSELPTIFTPYDGGAYIPLINGKIVEVKGKVLDAAITPDYKNIIVLEDDGNLYITDEKASKKKSIADDCNALDSVRNDGLVYRDDKGIYHRYLFSDGSDMSMGRAVAVAGKQLNIAFAGNDGKIYLLMSSSDEKQEIGTYSNKIRINAISDDGNTVVWVDYTKKKRTINLYSDGDCKILDEDGVYEQFPYPPVYAFFNDDCSFLEIRDFPFGYSFIKLNGQDVKRVEDVCVGSFEVYTAEGKLSDKTASGIEGIYVYSITNTNNVAWINTEGKSQTVCYDIKNFSIVNGRIYYINSDEELYSAAIDKEHLSDIRKIDDAVNQFVCAGEYLYYVKGCDEGNKAGSLYGYKSGADSRQVDSNVSGGVDLNISADGKTVYYFDDVNTLKKYTFGDDSSVWISSEAVGGSLTSGLKSGYINNNSFFYKKEVMTNRYGNKCVDYVYNDGMKNVTLINEVINDFYPADDLETSVILKEKIGAAMFAIVLFVLLMCAIIRLSRARKIKRKNR